MIINYSSHLIVLVLVNLKFLLCILSLMAIFDGRQFLINTMNYVTSHVVYNKENLERQETNK